MSRKPSPSDLPDQAWDLLTPYGMQPHGAGRPRTVATRAIVTAWRYRSTTGCQWRMLPHALPAWELVHSSFRPWTQDGTLLASTTVLREDMRVAKGRDPDPS